MKVWLAKLRRIRALTLKETRQILRDPSSMAIGIVFPVIMILLFGYGLSLDVNRVNVAVVDQDALRGQRRPRRGFPAFAVFRRDGGSLDRPSDNAYDGPDGGWCRKVVLLRPCVADPVGYKLWHDRTPTSGGAQRG